MEAIRHGKYKNQQGVTEDSEPVRVDGTRYTGTLANGSYEYAILDETGKINLNNLTDASGIILSNLLVNRGLSKEQADTVVDSVLDWRDADELVRLHGAESDYYMSLPNSYKSKNANLDTVEEALLIKGMTSEILYGTGGKPGVFDLLTVYSGTGGINLNAAPKEVLAALPGMTAELVDAVLSSRGRVPQVAGVPDNLQAVLGPAYPSIAPFMSGSASNIYSIEATGYSKTGGPGFTVKAVVAVESNGTYRYMHYKSSAGSSRPLEPQVQKNL